MIAVQNYVMSELGDKFVKPPPFDLAACYVDSAITNPLVFVLSAGSDPMENIFKLTPSQKFLRNFMSPYTPYRGLFVIHGTGVGKTCTGLTIAEQLKVIAIVTFVFVFFTFTYKINEKKSDSKRSRGGNSFQGGSDEGWYGY